MDRGIKLNEDLLITVRFLMALHLFLYMCTKKKSNLYNFEAENIEG